MSSGDQPAFLYAVSWEVCNRVGGVHTALETSAPYVGARYGDDRLYVGPDLWADRAPQAAFLEDALQPPVAGLAAERDVPVRFGRWKIEGSPRVALVDFGRLLERKDRLLGDLWNEFGVDSIHADWDTVERILFGYAAGMLIELHYHAVVRPQARRGIAHFHQWMTGAGLLRLQQTTPEIGTVYTPHGTVLGRALASDGTRLHEKLREIEPQASAQEQRIEAEHTLEVAAARHASVLTTVSEHTAEEAAHVLNRRPDLVTPNGYTSTVAPDPKHRDEVRAAIFRNAERFLGSPVDPVNTCLLLVSGRYEFKNKGLDTVIEVLGRVSAREEPPQRPVLCVIAVAAAQTGLRPEVTRRLKEQELKGEPCGIVTHKLARPEDDPVLQACREAGLFNRPDDAVRVVFAPVLLDGRDPVLPFSYHDVLQAGDLSVFPSLYEPWGYTPLESLAAGVPTVTTDLTGFGRFVLTLPDDERRAVYVLPTDRGGALVDRLEERLVNFLQLSTQETRALRRAGDKLLRRTSWERLVNKTLEAHDLALERTDEPGSALSPGLGSISRRSVIVIPGRSTSRPQLRRFTVSVALPERLERLAELARNVWWSWNATGAALFERLDADALREAGGSPARLLRALDPQRLSAAAADDGFLRMYDAVLAEYDAYRARPDRDVPNTAYFCAEFAVHESLPIYSGGLGVLAGDHLKSASDLRVPLTGVGLRYAHGYFVQRIQPDGRQGAEFPRHDPRESPLNEVMDREGNPLRITIQMPERDLQAGVWRADVGSVPLYLLDTLVPENDPADQQVTERLYPSDREPRLRQEILLGMGGWRLLKALGKAPDVCHLNEGHSAFLLLEHALNLVEEEGLTYAEAEAVVRAGTLFTTHTPVPAGHDRFSEGLMRRYFGHVAQRLGLDWDEFLDLGRASREEHEFSMTALALRLAGRVNGVSRLHGEVSRSMLANVWPGLHEKETPVDHVTNGVHLATWAGQEVAELLHKHVSPQWRTSLPAAEEWQRAEKIPDADLWAAHSAQKRRLMHALREWVERMGLRRGESPAALRDRLAGIDENALWIGFARRMAPYKRATLLFHDEKRLEQLLGDEDRPVRVVFSGKAHPDDREGGELIRELVRLADDERFEGKVFFVENYDLGVARYLVQGCDLWLNTPTRPLEASGTSGMKAALNLCPHASILDGWWCEGYDGKNGWAFGEGHEHESLELQREHDSNSLYSVLEAEIVPLFFERDGDDAPPRGWIERMRRSLATVPARFSTHRMLDDYVKTAYAPAGREAAELVEAEYAGARARAARHARFKETWDEVGIEDVSVTDLSRGSLGVGDVFEVRARVRLGKLSPDEVAVELYVGPADETGELTDPVVIPLLRDGDANDGVAEFTGAYLPKGTGTFRYGVRVLPALDSFSEAAHLGLVRWA